MNTEKAQNQTLVRRFATRLIVVLLIAFVVAEAVIFTAEGKLIFNRIESYLDTSLVEITEDIQDVVGVKQKIQSFVQTGEQSEAQKTSSEATSALFSSMSNHYYVGENGSVLILDSEGYIVNCRNDLDLIGLNITDYDADFSQVAEGDVTKISIEGAPYLCKYETVAGYYLLSMIPYEEFRVPLGDALLLTGIIIVLIFALLFFVLMRMLQKHVVEDLHSVRDSMEAIAQGDLDKKVDAKSSAEFVELSESVNATVGKLASAQSQIQKRIEEDMDRARSIQLSSMPNVFPPFKSIPEIDLYAFVRPTQEVGGDFYDFAKIQSDVISFEVADVSGKGIPGALFMMRAKTIIKGLVNAGMGIDEIMRVANNALCDNNEANMFVTVWFGLFEASSGRLIYSNAGHTHAIRRHADGSCEYMRTKPGLVMGAMEDMDYKFYVVPFDPGDVLFLYTDGVTEATNANNELYGEDRLLARMEQVTTTDPKEICDFVLADVDAFVGDAPQFDDITMLALEYRGKEKKEGEVKELSLEATVENIPVVTAFVDEQLEALDCPMKAQMQVDIAIDEIFSNIAHYAYNPEVGPATVRVDVTQEPLEVSITFIDGGKPYDPLSADDPDTSLSLEERGVGGLGVFMVKKTMDYVSYDYQEGKNILHIRKTLD